MATTVLPIDASGGAPAYTAQQTRQAWAAFMGPAPAGRPLGVRSGVRMGTPTTTVNLSGTWSMTWNCAAHNGIVDAESAAAGPYLYATDGTDTGTITAANATNPRIDIIYLQINDTIQDGSGLRNGVITYLAGTPASSPVAPTPPNTRTLVLANINVPVSGGGAPTVSWVAPTYYGFDGMLRQAGATTYTGTIAASGSASVNITFPIPYSVAPTWASAMIAGFVTNSSLVFVRMVDQITTTGMRISLLNMNTGSSAVTNLPINWFAMGTP